MPKQKDLKRLVRARMQKTGEAYTAARRHVVRPTETEPDYAPIAGLSDDSVSRATGRTWAEWVRLLDAEGAAEKAHSEITAYVASHGTPSWWTQMVTVGYERIRGLRAIGQRRDGGYTATKSRTFTVPVETLFDAFAKARTRAKWLPVKVTVRSSTPPKSMRMVWEDGTVVLVGFLPKGEARSTVAIEHQKLADKAAADAMKATWSEYLDRLRVLLR
jgi:uncharacterized protein YndB with AHSA1/START domain